MTCTSVRGLASHSWLRAAPMQSFLRWRIVLIVNDAIYAHDIGANGDLAHWMVWFYYWLMTQGIVKKERIKW